MVDPMKVIAPGAAVEVAVAVGNTTVAVAVAVAGGGVIVGTTVGARVAVAVAVRTAVGVGVELVAVALGVGPGLIGLRASAMVSHPPLFMEPTSAGTLLAAPMVLSAAPKPKFEPFWYWLTI